MNKVSLVVIVLIDIFILINVFTGIDDISRWYISPYQAYPCHSEWQSYRAGNNQDKDYNIIKKSLPSKFSKLQQEEIYRQAESEHLGKVSQTCLNYAQYKDKVNNPKNQEIVNIVENKEFKINELNRANTKIRAEYDSTLLEKIAGQPRGQSINQVSAEKAKIELDKNTRNISTLEKEISNLKKELTDKPESLTFLNFLQDKNQFYTVDKGYKQASFWYPTIQLTFQSLFLIPLIAIALSVHKFAVGRGYGLISLISWHLLIIFFIPLIIKVFEFLQFGAIFEFLFDFIQVLFGGLRFLVSYLYILFIPLIGFGIIKFFQKIVFNTKIQASNRFQKLSCIRCAKKIRNNDIYCPHCGYYQYVECPNCHNMTYKYLSYCKHCGHSQDIGNL